MPSTAALRPDVAVSNNWDTTNGTFPGNLADAVTQPTAPSTASGFIRSATAGDVAEADVGTETLPGGATVTGATLWLYGSGGAKRAVGATLKTGSTVLAGSDTNRVIAAAGAEGWYSLSYSGSLTQSQIDGLRCRFAIESTAGGGGAGTCSVYAAYIVVDYSVVTTHERSAALSVATAIATTGTFFSVISAAAALSASTTVASAGSIAKDRSASLAAASSIATTPQRDLQRSASLAGGASLTSAGRRDVHRQAALTGAAAVTVSGYAERSRSASLSASGSITGTGQRDLQRASAISAASSLQAIGEVAGGAAIHHGSAALAASSSLAAAGSVSRVLERAGAVSATAALTVGGEHAPTVGAIDGTGGPAGAIIAASGTATHADSSAGITGADSGSSSSSGDGTSGSAFPSSTSFISAGDGGSTMFGAIG